jgi:uncharacterized membrane protein YeaQ/YmgE (transglycosylase-associated protein family)
LSFELKRYNSKLIIHNSKSNLTFSLTTDDIPRILVMLVLASVLGWFANLFTGGRVPLRWFGTIIFGLLGAWVATQVVRTRIPFALPKEPSLDGVMLVTAGLGAFVFALLWCIFASRLVRR